MAIEEVIREQNISARYASGERDFADVDLPGAVLSGAHLEGADLARAVLRQAHLDGATLSRADLSEVNLMGAHMEGARLESANLGEANLMGAILCHASLTAADITRANLVYADARHADLRDADLCGADLSGADLSHADLSGATLAGGTLVGTRLDGAILTEVDLDGADLTDARFSTDLDLLACRWQTVIVGGVLYDRANVERGAQVLPLGSGDPLTFIFQNTRSLGAPDLLAVRDLVRAFALVASGAALDFEIHAGGERIVLRCAGDSVRGYADAFGLGLDLIAAAARPAEGPSRTRLTRDLADGLRELSSRPPPPDRSSEFQRAIDGVESSADAIARMLTAFEPVRLQLRNAEDVRAFRAAADVKGIALDELLSAEAGWTLLPRFVAHYLQLPLSSPLLPQGLTARATG